MGRRQEIRGRSERWESGGDAHAGKSVPRRRRSAGRRGRRLGGTRAPCPRVDPRVPVGFGRSRGRTRLFEAAARLKRGFATAAAGPSTDGQPSGDCGPSFRSGHRGGCPAHRGIAARSSSPNTDACPREPGRLNEAAHLAPTSNRPRRGSGRIRATSRKSRPPPTRCD